MFLGLFRLLQRNTALQNVQPVFLLTVVLVEAFCENKVTGVSKRCVEYIVGHCVEVINMSQKLHDQL